MATTTGLETLTKGSLDQTIPVIPQYNPIGFPIDSLAPPTSGLLTVAPYTESEHLLDLESVDQQCRLLALALTELDAATPRYATVKYEEALNWSSVISKLREIAAAEGLCWRRRDFYVVEFRSKLKPDIDNIRLFQLDKESHREATESGGLLKYWFGKPDEERRNLATCVWRDKEDAVKGGQGPWHRQARGVIPKMYEDINVKGIRLTIDDGAKSWSFGPF